MTETYVRRLFDQYAGRYDTALTEHLHYRGPALLRDAVEAAMRARGKRPMHFRAMLDLGCGTGLAGAAFRPFVDRLVGVDLSPAMIAQAASKGLYDRLVDRRSRSVFLPRKAPAAGQYRSRHRRRRFRLRQRSRADRRGGRARSGAGRHFGLHGRNPFRRRREAVADAALCLRRGVPARGRSRRQV